MALYRPDYVYQEAKEMYIDKLGNSKKDQAIKYYIEKNEINRKKDKEKIKQYQDFFEKLSSFLPSKNILF